MRKTAFLIAMVIICTFGAFSACNKKAENEEPIPKTYTVEFLGNEGGRIVGLSKQTVNEGESTERVWAMANDGYYFAGWLDGETQTDETVVRAERIIENVTRDCLYIATFEIRTVSVEYIAGANGSVQGVLTQSVKYGENTEETVTAVPYKGYRFVNWSDGSESATRSEIDLRENKSLTANFELITNTYTYDYKFADGNCDAESVSLTYGQVASSKLIVPEREHCTFGGWFADKWLTCTVADGDGNITVDEDFLYEDYERLYAKWNTENTHEYKVLVVYVTELRAALPTKDDRAIIKMNYKMSETERRLCEMLTQRISFELNDLAVCKFTVDEYYTTVPLDNENIETEKRANYMDSTVWAYDIPEVYGILDNYDSVLVSFSFGDGYKMIVNKASIANMKYGSIHFDGFLDDAIRFGYLEDMYDRNCRYWNSEVESYLDALAYTVELMTDEFIEFNKVFHEYFYNPDRLMPVKLYFTNKAVVDGQTVGIPYEFWEGKYARLYYGAQEGGYVYNESLINKHIYGRNDHGTTLFVLCGNDAMSVTAQAYSGYEFAEWSDGVKTATRKDMNITGDMQVYAIFRKTE